MLNFKKHGHNPILLVGGATALIGDPSGKTEMRQMLTKEEQKKIPELLKFTYSRLGREILKCCGEEYKNAFSLSLREEKNQVDSVEI